MPNDPGTEIPDPRSGPAVAGAHGGAAALAEGKQWFGHPRGLATLFFTEMWERFSYYGMRAILILFLTAAATGPNPGMGLGTAEATAIYGLYTFFVYVLALPGGWVADNLWGARRAVFVGGVIIMMGHVSLAIPTPGTFYLGLALIVIGTGLLKPNVSTMVGDIYPEGGARRDAGFSIFYMGINIGALAGPFLVGLVGENYNFHWGFALAAIGMFMGLVQYRLGGGPLGTAGRLKTDATADQLATRSRNFYLTAAASLGAVLLVAYLIRTGILPVTIQQVASFLGTSVGLLAVLFFSYLILGPRWVVPMLVLAAVSLLAATQLMQLDGFVAAAREQAATADPRPSEGEILSQARQAFYIFAYQVAIGITLLTFLAINLVRMVIPSVTVTQEKQRLFVIFWLFLLAALFWMGFEQAGSSLNLFARDLTDRTAFGWEIPASWLQNVNPFFIILFAPIFGWLWTWLARRNANPNIPLKFALGLFGLAAGFFVLAWGSANASPESPVSMSWLVVTYFFHTAGELCLSPVGLSSMTKLAPRDRVGQMMGVWFIAAALGNLFAGITAGQLETLAPSALFWNVALLVGGGGVLALLASPFVKKLTGGVE